MRPISFFCPEWVWIFKSTLMVKQIPLLYSTHTGEEVVTQLLSRVQLFVTHGLQASLSLTVSQSLPRFISTWVGDAIQSSHSLPPSSPLPSVFPLHGSLPCHGEGACVTQWSYEPCHAGPPERETDHSARFWQNLVPWRREWQTTLVFLLEKPVNHIKRGRRLTCFTCCLSAWEYCFYLITQVNKTSKQPFLVQRSWDKKRGRVFGMKSLFMKPIFKGLFFHILKMRMTQLWNELK